MATRSIHCALGKLAFNAVAQLRGIIGLNLYVFIDLTIFVRSRVKTVCGSLSFAV